MMKLSHVIRPVLGVLCMQGLMAASVDDLTYTSDGSSITITDCDVAASGIMDIPAKIPDTVDGLPVTRIDGQAFQDCDNLTSVTIPDSVTYVGSNSFSRCGNLTSVVIGDSVLTISRSAFASCSLLSSVTFGSSVRTIDDRAFDGTSLASVSLPDSVERINDYAFRSNPFTTITLGPNVDTVESRCFSGCSNLASINVVAANPDFSSLGGSLYNKSRSKLCLVPNTLSGTFATPASVDTIGENALGTDPLNGDSDGDGVSDGDEENGWGTDPLDAGDRFSFADDGAIDIVGDQVTIRWNSRVGKTYKMEGNINLDSDGWDELPGTVPGTGGEVSFSTTLTEGGYRFYRVKVIE